MKKNRNHRIIRHKDTILRILDTEENKVLAIDCVKRGMPKWISLSGLKDGVEISKEDFGKEKSLENAIETVIRHWNLHE